MEVGNGLIYVHKKMTTVHSEYKYRKICNHKIIEEIIYSIKYKCSLKYITQTNLWLNPNIMLTETRNMDKNNIIL